MRKFNVQKTRLTFFANAYLLYANSSKYLLRASEGIRVK